jgi:hypothetical protein
MAEPSTTASYIFDQAIKLMDEQSVDFIDHLHILPFSCDFDGGEFYCHETRTEQEQSFNLKFLMFDDFVMVWGTSSLS